MKGRGKTRPRRLATQVTVALCALILPFNILSILISGILLQRLRQGYEDTLMSALRTQAGAIEQRMDNADYFLYDRPTNDTDFLRYPRNGGDWHHELYRLSIAKKLENEMLLSNSADAMFVFLPDREELTAVSHFYVRSDGEVAPRLGRVSLTALLTEDPESLRSWQLRTLEGEDWLLRAAPQDGYLIGAYLSCGDLTDRLQRSDAWPSAVYRIGEPSARPERGMLECACPLGNTGVWLVCAVPLRLAVGSAAVWQYASVALMVLSLCIIPVFFAFFRRRIDQPLGVLRSAFRQLEQGRESYRITERASTAEFDETFRSFNSMAATTERLRTEAMMEQRRRHALDLHNLGLQLENLQLQIRPHFLQNMMNFLFTLIQNRRIAEAQDLVLYLSHYFRLMFRKGREMVPFDEELGLIREYLRLSALHYAGAFTVSYQIDPLLSLVQVPPILLHNFVENIIQHALSPGRVVHIVVGGEYDEDRETVTLRVSDDGPGMPPDFVRMVNARDFSGVAPGQHIGIRNAIDRLRFYYSGQAELSLDSAPGEGATFTLEFPYAIPAEALTDEIGEEGAAT